MKRIIKHLQLPSGLQSGLPMAIDKDCTQFIIHALHCKFGNVFKVACDWSDV